MKINDTRLALPHQLPAQSNRSYMELQLVDNPNPRCPVALLLDCSSSMAGAPLAELQQGLAQFYAEMTEDPVTRQTVEVVVITFGSFTGIAKPFCSLFDSQALRLPVLRAGGHTPLGAALDLGVKQLEKRRSFYKQAGLPAYRPWIVTLSDGAPNDDWFGPAQDVRSRAERQKLFSVAVGIGSAADLSTLGTFTSPELPPRRLQGLCFREFFKWLADSLRSTSGSGDLSNIPQITDPSQWAQPTSGFPSGNLWDTAF